MKINDILRGNKLANSENLQIYLNNILENKTYLEEGLLDKIVNVGVLTILSLSAYAGLSLKDILTKPEIPIEKKVDLAKSQGVNIQTLRTEPEVLPSKEIQTLTQPINIKLPKVKTIFGSKLEEYLLHVAEDNNIKGIELASFMAQCAHETNNYRNLVEIGDNNRWQAYELKKNLGNKYKGDGYKYRGRGYIQLTGRYNYMLAGKELGIPLEQQPDLAADPVIAANIAIWFWKKRVQPNITDYRDVASVTKPINPNLRGLESRKNKFQQYIDNI
jgi:putative chitinase